jgi:electron transfer flavoprotein alpha subunit
VLPALVPRVASEIGVATLEVVPRGGVRVLSRERDDDLDVLAEAPVVIGVGQGVPPEEYAALDPLRRLLGAELGATRKVTDRGWLPRARQIGITGRSISPRLYLSLAASGKFNHSVGVRAAGTVVAVVDDPHAPAVEHADVTVVGDWREAADLLAGALRRVLAAPSGHALASE